MAHLLFLSTFLFAALTEHLLCARNNQWVRPTSPWSHEQVDGQIEMYNTSMKS